MGRLLLRILYFWLSRGRNGPFFVPRSSVVAYAVISVQVWPHLLQYHTFTVRPKLSL